MCNFTGKKKKMMFNGHKFGIWLKTKQNKCTGQN